MPMDDDDNNSNTPANDMTIVLRTLVILIANLTRTAKDGMARLQSGSKI